MQIISASRRTDIPAFYMDWFMKRLRAGTVAYPNPFFSGQAYRVSLSPEDVHSIVFWSKNAAPLLPCIPELEKRAYRFYIHYTITGAPRLLEPHVPDWQHGVKTARQLAAQLSPRHVLWRFDPLIFTTEYGADPYLSRFRELAQALEGATERCYISFAAYYGKVAARLKKLKIPAVDPPLEEKLALLDQMAAVAAEHGITLYACSQDMLVSEKVRRAHCVDGDLLAELFPDRPHITKAYPTREQCGCVYCRDIGVYNTCPYGCVYCYANQLQQRAVDNLRLHDPEGLMLINNNCSGSL